MKQYSKYKLLLAISFVTTIAYLTFIHLYNNNKIQFIQTSLVENEKNLAKNETDNNIKIILDWTRFFGGTYLESWWEVVILKI
jgi:hypothetical protein